jgi:TonB family protein
MTVLADLTLRSSLVLLAGLTLHGLLARRSAALRHWVLAAAIAAAAAVVPLSLAIPDWEVSVPALLPSPIPSAFREVPRATPAAAETAAVPPRGPVLPLALLVWAAGFAVTAVLLVTGIVRLARVARRAEPVRDGPWVSTAHAVARDYGLRREVVVLRTDLPDLLATWGFLRPRVLLPSHAGDWSEDRIHAVLCHELAHVRRHDWFVQISAQALLTVGWFNPLLWLACRELRRESERACDDAVLDRGVPARVYATHLLDVARQCRRSDLPWAPAAPMAHPSTLERRIAAMLNPRLNRTALSRRAAFLTAVLLVAVALPTAALRGAQGAPAPLSGSVYDPSGGVLPGVELTLEDAQQVKWQATTNAAGRFEFAGVPGGRYVLAASLPGFRSLRHEFELRTTRDWNRAVTLQVGDLTETIHVSAPRVTPPPVRQPRGPQPIRVGGNIRVPTKVEDVRPVYPMSMRETGQEGVVFIDAIIGSDGRVTSVRVLTGQVHPDFAVSAADAVRQWRFTPTLLNGQAVEVVMTVTVTFKLED